MKHSSFGHKNPKVPLEVYRPPSYLAPAVKERKTRTGKPKTRSGCKTCKLVPLLAQPRNSFFRLMSQSNLDEQNKKS